MIEMGQAKLRDKLEELIRDIALNETALGVGQNECSLLMNDFDDLRGNVREYIERALTWLKSDVIATSDFLDVKYQLVNYKLELVQIRANINQKYQDNLNKITSIDNLKHQREWVLGELNRPGAKILQFNVQQ